MPFTIGAPSASHSMSPFGALLFVYNCPDGLNCSGCGRRGARHGDLHGASQAGRSGGAGVIRSRPMGYPGRGSGSEPRVGPEHGDGFNFDQQFRAAEDRLDSGGSRHGVELLLAEELGAFLVEGLVIAFDIAQVAGGAHNVVPGGAFGFEEPGDVAVGAPQLSAEVANVDAASLLVDACGAGDQEDGETVQVDTHTAYKRARFGVVVGLVEYTGVSDGAFFNR